MIFSEKLQLLRKNRGMTQEELAEKLQVSRQAVAKWESGQSYPDIMNLIQISEMFRVTVDYLVKDQDCIKSPLPGKTTRMDKIVDFLLEAKKETYAANADHAPSSRPESIDYRYEKPGFLYIDTYLGGELFTGEEAVWAEGIPVYAMNYSGRVLADSFDGNFLKAALRKVPREAPYRGPMSYHDGDYLYQCRVNGDMDWFQGYEEIYCREVKVYECFFHGGKVK